MRTVDVIVAILLVLGGANWGLIGAFDVNVIEALLGEGSIVTRGVYGLVGLSALYQALQIKGIQRRWQWAAQAH